MHLRGHRPFREYYRVTGWLENEPYPGVRECLQALQGAAKRMYVATSARDHGAGRCYGLTRCSICGRLRRQARRIRRPERRLMPCDGVLRENGTDDLFPRGPSGDREYDILGGIRGVQIVGVL